MICKFLYRGANSDLHRHNEGVLIPKDVSAHFERVVHYGGETYYGDGSTYGASEANAVIMHQRDSVKYPTSGVSTTTSFEHAKNYALNNGAYQTGVVYKIQVDLLEQYGVSSFRVQDYAVQPSVPEDEEVILVVSDFGPLPAEIVIETIDVFGS